MKRKILVSIILGALFLLVMTGCGQEEKASAPEESWVAQSETFSPMLQADGGKLRIGLLGVFEYEPAAIYIYHVLEALKEDGWIDYERLPFTSTNTDVKTMIQMLSEMDLGPYIEFVGDAAYYLEYEEEEDIVSSMNEQIASQEGLDIVLCMGTDPGLFMKNHDLDVTAFVCMATDPVASGIIPSAQDSGAANLWAQVEPSPYARQLRYYHNILPFENIGMVYADPIIAGIPDYETAAAELGVTMTNIEVTEDEAADETALREIYLSLLDEDIDALMLCAGLVTSDMDVSALLEPFTQAGIPVFVQDGENYVEGGALLLVASTDNEGVGRFVAETIEQVASGTPAGDLTMEYVSSPYISLNLDTAKRIGFQPDFDLLLSCETIYPGASQNGGGEADD